MKKILLAIFMLSFANVFFAQKNFLSAKTHVDWANNIFFSEVELDTKKANIQMPSGRNEASRILKMRTPIVIKEPLFSLYVDNETQVADLIKNDELSISELSDLLEKSSKTPAVFKNNTMTIQSNNSLNLKSLASFLMKQKIPHELAVPLERIATRPYSGIIIDARGKLPVQGEFSEEETLACFFPKVWDEEMNVLFEKNMVLQSIAKNSGIVLYGAKDWDTSYASRIGNDALYIKAQKVYGRNRCDPVISKDDALRITSNKDNLKLLQNGKIVILIDAENLSYDIALPEKTENYYASYNTIQNRLYESGDNKIEIDDSPNGIRILMKDLKFQADSSALVPEDKKRIASIAEEIKAIVQNGGYTILVEGHTADVGKPVGQMNLSIERTKTIMNELIGYGIPSSLFTYKGYGGTMPEATNETDEGRRQNRRVIITIRPVRQTYIQRY